MYNKWGTSWFLQLKHNWKWRFLWRVTSDMGFGPKIQYKSSILHKNYQSIGGSGILCFSSWRSKVCGKSISEISSHLLLLSIYTNYGISHKKKGKFYLYFPSAITLGLPVKKEVKLKRDKFYQTFSIH